MMYSVVIPVFNTDGQLLRRCIESVYHNTEASFEIIVVDDGSTEEVARLLDRMAGEHPGMKVCHLDHNGGVSAARNIGTLKAAGDYITYLDSDDELVPGILDHLSAASRCLDADLILTDIGRGGAVLPDAGDGDQASAEQLIRMNKEQLSDYYLLMNVCGLRGKEHWLNRAPHGRFVRRELALKVRFKENLSFGEDVVWNMMLLKEAGSVFHLPVQGYVYHKNLASATQKERRRYPYEVREIFSCFHELLPDRKKELSLAAIEYYTILMRVYVFASSRKGRYRRYVKERHTSFWEDVFSTVDISRLTGKYKVTAILERMRFHPVVYMIYQLHHCRSGVRR